MLVYFFEGIYVVVITAFVLISLQKDAVEDKKNN